MAFNDELKKRLNINPPAGEGPLPKTGVSEDLRHKEEHAHAQQFSQTELDHKRWLELARLVGGDPDFGPTRASYLGGHPTLLHPAEGELLLAQGTIGFAERVRRGVKRVPCLRFTIPTDSVSRVELKTEHEMKNAPQGYWKPLPIPVAWGFGGKPKHPIRGMPLTYLVTLEMADGGAPLVLANPTTGTAPPFWRREPSLHSGAPEKRAREVVNRLAAGASPGRT